MSETEIMRREVQTGTRVGDDLPKVGEYYWIRVTEEDAPIEEGEPNHVTVKEVLACVAYVASNHVGFKDGVDSWSLYQIRHCRLLQDIRPAPEWREELTKQLDELRLEMQTATQSLYDEAIKKGALPGPDANPEETERDRMLPAVVAAADIQAHKRGLIALRDTLPQVTKKIDALAKQYAHVSLQLCAPELFRMQQTQKELKVLEDKIFTIEVYAGLSEQIKHIRKGKDAGPNEKIAIRQAMLFMDEETLFDWDEGGLDFSSLPKFDRWIARDATLARILPEPRGVVAFRVRRREKDYGPVHDLATAWKHAEWHQANKWTYIVIRNGANVYRIISDIDFSPRLVPLRNEFDDAFKVVHSGWYNWEKRKSDPDTIERITPDHLDYDKHARSLQDRLKHYNRIIVLLQGLLDRSEVFHPHPPINLAGEFEQWLNVIRDEEDVLDDGSEEFETYKERLNGIIVEGKIVYTGLHRDLRRRPYYAAPLPKLIEVEKLREGKASDAIPPHYVRGGYGGHEGRDASDCIGVLGVEVAWDSGRKRTNRTWDHVNARYAYKDSAIRQRAWIPMKQVFNVTDYKPGDFKKFAGSRRHKANYQQWAPPLLNAELYHSGKLKLEGDD